jgi:hypothetical protein
MTSTRTIYRQRRIELIKEIINLLLNMLLLPKQELEDIPLPLLKRVKKMLETKKVDA